MIKKAFVLLSGGLDSATCLYRAYDEFDGSCEAVSMNYGQRHIKEASMAAKLCENLGIKHTILNLGDLLSGENVMLTNASRETMAVPDTTYDQIKGLSPTYVPFRNGTMLAVLTAFAQKYVMGEIAEYTEQLIAGDMKEDNAKEAAMRQAKDLCAIYYGAHAEDAQNWAYPDCTPEFNGSMANAIYIGSYQTIRLITPYQWSKKYEIVMSGVEMGVPYEDTWSCYKGEEEHCGTCPTCHARKVAFAEADCTDPTDYKE